MKSKYLFATLVLFLLGTVNSLALSIADLEGMYAGQRVERFNGEVRRYDVAGSIQEVEGQLFFVQIVYFHGQPLDLSFSTSIDGNGAFGTEKDGGQFERNGNSLKLTLWHVEDESNPSIGFDVTIGFNLHYVKKFPANLGHR